MSVLGAGEAFMMASGEEGPFEISRSLRFNSVDQSHLSRTPSSVGNRTTWTWSAWIKRAKLGTGQRFFTGATSTNDVGWTSFHFLNDKLYISGYSTHYRISNRLFRDPGAWFHLVVKYELGASAEADKIKAWYNGEEITWETSNTAPTQGGVNDTNNHTIGAEQSPNDGGLNSYCDLYLAEVNFVDGQALAPTDFGEYDDNNVWQAKKYTGSYGTNGFRLDFSDTSNLGNDAAGSNNWTPNNLAAVDSLIDTPMNIDASSGNNPGNYATFNPLDAWASMSFANGNLEMSDTANGGDKGGFLTLGPTSGKFYWEITFTTLTSDGYVGLAKKGRTQSSSDIYSGAVDAYVYYKANGNKIGQNNGGGGESYGATWAANDVMGVAVDWDAGSIIFYKNGTSQGTAWTGEDLSEYMPAVYFNTNGSGTAVLNTGQRPFSISSVPTGYKSLCTANLPDPTIADGSTAFDAKLYTGNSSTQTISGLGFSPDLVWLKSRSETARSHSLYDTVRGTTKVLKSDNTDAEATMSGLTAFNSDGFALGSHVNSNNNNVTYVGWAWDGGNLVTNSAYNQSRTWSDNAVGGRADEPIEDLFDGSVSTFAQNPSGGANPNNLVVNFSPGLAYTTSVEVYPYNASSVAINNGSQNSTTNQQWNTVVSGSGTLTKLDFQRDHTNGCAISAIRVDGKILVNPGVVPVGSLNSSVYNQSQTWSNSLSATFRSSEPATNAFDGNTSTIAGSAGSITYTSPVAVASSSTIRVIVHGGDHTVSVNSGANQTVAAGSYVTLNFTNPTNSTFTITFDRVANGADTGVRAIEIGGKLLVDNGVSVTNVPLIPQTICANPSAGFSIVKVDNPTATESRAHGLSSRPDFIIGKAIASGSSQQWHIYHSALGKGYYGTFQASAFSSSDQWGSKEPDTNLFYVKANTGSGANFAGGMIYYIWHAVNSYSAFGSYTGTGSTDGPFIYTGFKSRFVLIKETGSSNPWFIYDTVRNTYNTMDNILWANSNNSEATIGSGDGSNQNGLEILSNGFKIPHSLSGTNRASGSYIYAAFAEHPFKSSRAR